MKDVSRTIRESKKKMHQAAKDRKGKDSAPGESARKSPAGKRLQALRERKKNRE